MISNTNSIFPTKYRILSGSALKLIALITMLIDHVAAFIIAKNDILIPLGHYHLSLYGMMRLIGRMAFPIFAFLIVEGFIHTRSRKRYGVSLLVFAFISEIPWDLVHGSILYERQNVIFTLFFGYLCLCILDIFRDKIAPQAILFLAVLLVSWFFNADYGLNGVIFIVMLYFTSDHKFIQLLLGCCLLNSTWRSGLAFIPINMYNEKRGFIKGTACKYAFYLFYPLHLLLIWFVTQ